MIVFLFECLSHVYTYMEFCDIFYIISEPYVCSNANDKHETQYIYSVLRLLLYIVRKCCTFVKVNTKFYKLNL